MHGNQVLRSALCISIALMATMGRPAAQDKPDFSGSWVLESGTPTGTDAPQALSVSQSVSRTNMRGEPIGPFFKDITITRTLASGPQSETLQIGVVGGKTPGLPARPGQDRWLFFRVVWEGDALVMEQSSSEGPEPERGNWAARREEWTFDAAGQLRVTVTSRGSSGPPTTVVLVYRRQ